MYQTSFEVSIFENTYFVNKLYIVKYVFLHRHFSYAQNFLVQFKEKEKKRKKIRKSHYLFRKKMIKCQRT